MKLFKKRKTKRTETILENNKETAEYLSSLPKIYLIAHWASWGIREYPFAGEYNTREDGVSFPIVWNYNDHNGLYDRFEKVDVRYTTTGAIKDWTFNKHAAELLVEKLNEKENKNDNCM